METISEKAMTEIRKEHQFDVKVLENYMQEHIVGNKGSFKGPLSVKQFKSGQSNPTFFLKDGNGREYVMRKKPPGKLLASAHMIEREYQIMNALNKCDFPVPKTLVYCENKDIIGTPFYIMEFVRGRIFRDVGLKDEDPKSRAEIMDELNRVLAKLHKVDFRAIGLENYGKTTDYYARQIATWTRQYQNSKTSDIPNMEKLMEWLPKNIPKDSNLCSLVHGDFRLDNVIFDEKEPKILAVLDWELSTLGHPFGDLAYNVMMYYMPPPMGFGGEPRQGIPSWQEYVKKYCERMNLNKIDRFGFYMAFSLFRMAGIAQGVYKRALQGNASAPNALDHGPMVQHLADLAWTFVEEDSQTRSKL